MTIQQVATFCALISICVMDYVRFDGTFPKNKVPESDLLAHEAHLAPPTSGGYNSASAEIIAVNLEQDFYHGKSRRFYQEWSDDMIIFLSTGGTDVNIYYQSEDRVVVVANSLK
jgi:hypothetical protein